MAKKGIKTKSLTVVKCQCSVCGQESNAQPNTEHHSCRGMKLSIIEQLPPLFKDICRPDRKGTWQIVIPEEIKRAIAS